MADANSTTSVSQGAAAPVVAPTELVVILNPYNLDFSKFVGSRAMLEAEGVIPDGTKWPEGYDDLRWQAGKFDYWLHRQRPEGAKGPRRDFADCDWWCLRWKLTNAPSYEARQIMLKAKALKDAIYRHSVEGRQAFNKQIKSYFAALDDARFQQFKAAIPGLVPPRRGRRPKNAEHSQGAQ